MLKLVNLESPMGHAVETILLSEGTTTMHRSVRAVSTRPIQWPFRIEFGEGRLQSSEPIRTESLLPRGRITEPKGCPGGITSTAPHTTANGVP